MIIRNTTSSNRYEELNGENTLNFSTILDTKIKKHFTENSILELDNDYFDVAYTKKEYNSEGIETLEVEAEHVSYRLNNPIYDLENFIQADTPSYILGMILSGTGLTVGSVSDGGTISYTVLEKTSRRQLLMGFVNMLGGEVQFDKFSVSILTKRGSRDVQLYTTGKNVDIVSKVVNKRELDTSGNHLVSYVCESILLKNKTVGVGDDILLVQPGLGIRESLRVVSYSYNPYESYSTELVINNFVHGIEDEMYRIASFTNSAVAKGNMYNIEAFYDINKCFIDYEGGDYLTVRDKSGVVVGQINISTDIEVIE